MSESTENLPGLSTSLGKPVPLKEVNVNITISGFVARVETILGHKNDLTDPVEAVFTFPLDDGSAVFKFEAKMEGRHIIAECQEREQAKLTYQDGIEHGDMAVLLKQDDAASDIFQCTLGNLPPECSATLILAYVVDLAREFDGKLRFKLPTVLNPRYTPEDRIQAGDGACLVEAANIPYTFSLTVTVHGSQKVSSVSSEKDELIVEISEDGFTAQATLKQAFSFDHDLTFLVEYENPFVPQAILEKGNPESDGLLKEDILMLNFQPDLKEVAMATCGEFIFVIDRSGSMTGDRIARARDALLLFLKSLPADCYFNVVSFGSEFSSLFKSSKKYTSAALEQAISLQQKIEANMGGTEILKPLRHILSKTLIPEHPRQVFLLTDGDVSNVQEVISEVKKHAGSTRMFTVGIGEGASTALCKGAARAGNGKAEFISDNDRLQPKVIALLKQAMQPAMTQLEYIWDLPPGVTVINIPQELPGSLVSGERLTVFAILQNVDTETVYAESSLTLKGHLNKNKEEYQMTFTLNAEEDVQTVPVFHHLAAKAQIKQLQDSEPVMKGYYNPSVADELEKSKAKIVLISKVANILSKYTSFVAVDTERREPVQGTMVPRAVPVPTVTREYFDSFLSGLAFDECMDIQTVHLCSTVESGDLDLKKCSPPMRARGRQLMLSAGPAKKSRKKSSSGVGSLFSCFGKNHKYSTPVTEDDMMTMGAEDDMMKMVILQCLHGNWLLTNDLALLLHIKKDILEADDLVKETSVLATISAVAWLRVNYTDRKGEWEIVETKALSWLHDNNTSTKDVEDLISEFMTKYQTDITLPSGDI